MNTKPQSYHVAYDIPANMRHLLDGEDTGRSWDFCAVGLATREAAEEVAARANEVHCHGAGVVHRVMSDAEVEATR